MTDNFNPTQLARRDSSRLQAYKSNNDFYHGTQWKSTGRHRQLTLNYARVAVDKITSYLVQGKGAACYPATPQGTATVNQAEALLQSVYRENNIEELDWETELDAAVMGDGCYKVTWDAEGEHIRITAPDVSGIYAWWIGDDASRVWRVASQYKLSADEIGMLYGVTVNGNAVVTELWTDSEFSLYIGSDRIQHMENPYGFIPFVIFPNLREPKKFWGTSDIPALIEPQRELNRATSQLSRILELSGNPITILKGVTDSEGNIRIQPGQYWEIPEDASVDVLDMLKGGGMQLHLDYIDLLYRCLHDLSETPRAAYGGVERDLSGAALNIEMGSLSQKVGRKRTIRTPAYWRRDGMILRLAEKFMKFDFSQVSHRVTWGGILPADIANQAQSEQLLVQAGVHSRRTAMDEMGVMDPDREFDRWLEERERILRMNTDLKASSTKGGARERATAPEMEAPQE